jgi:hypothetical protein
MAVPIPFQDAQRALAALGVTQTDLNLIRRSQFSQAQALLKDLKIKAHRKYRELALELHPDRTQGDKSKTDFFVLLGRVLEELDKTTVQPPLVTHQVFTSPSFWGTTSGTATTTNTGFTTGFTTTQVIRVVRMRPK